MEKHKVLFVDDDSKVLSSIQRALLDEPYKCILTTSASDALNILRKDKISVIVSDIKMPGLDGLTFLKEIKEKYPDTIRVVLSGYAQLPQVLAVVNQADIFRFLLKPWDNDKDLKPVLSQAIKYYETIQENKSVKSLLEKRNIAYKNMLKSMEEKLVHAKKGYSKAKSISDHVFDIIKKVSDTDYLDSYFISAVHKIYSGYLNVLPINKEKYSLSYLSGILSKDNELIRNSVEVRFIGNWSSDLYFNSDVKLIVYLIETAIQLVKNTNGTKLNISIIPESNGLSFSVQWNYSEEDKKINSALYDCSALLNDIACSLEGIVTYEEKDSTIKLEFPKIIKS